MTDETPVPVHNQPTGPKWYKRRRWQAAVGGVVILLIGIGIGSAGGSSGKSKASASPEVRVTETRPVPGETATVQVTTTATATMQTTVTAPPPPPQTAFAGDGTFLIGSDVVPGVYKAAASPGCYWEIDNSSTGLSKIIANDNTEGPAVINIPANAFSVTTSRCADFHHA